MKRMGKQWYVKCLLLALIAVFVLAGGIHNTRISYAAETPNDVRLSKTADPVGVNEWEVTLKVNGSAQRVSSDIVILMDRSRSMNLNEVNKMEKAVDAVINLVGQIRDLESDARVAVIAFNRTAAVEKGFTSLKDENDSDELIQAIGNIYAEYEQEDMTSGTNIQAGIHAAAELLKDSNAESKIIVLVGDGEPTHSYRLTDVEGIELDCSVEGTVHNSSWDLSDAEEFYSYDDSSIMGPGNDYWLFEQDLFIVKACPEDSSVFHYYFYEYPSNNGIPAIYESKMAIAQGINIYSVGIGLIDEGREILKKCQNAGLYDIKISDTAYDFSGIAAAIGSEAFQSVVTDPVGYAFQLNSDISISKGEYEYKNGEITWNVGVLNPGETAVMTYRVKAMSGFIFNKNKAYPTNGATLIEYQYPENETFTAEFNVPEVYLTGGAVSLKAITVNSKGEPLTSSGTIASDITKARLLNQSRFPAASDEFMVYGDCQVSMDLISGYQYRGYVNLNTDGTVAAVNNSGNTANIELTPENGSPTVYFKYSEESGGDDDDWIPPALNKDDHIAYMVGYPDGEIKPLGNITREEVAVIFYRLMTEESRNAYRSTSHPFTDVEHTRWSNEAIATLYHAKIIGGNPDGSFEPSNPITRAEFASIASKFDQLVYPGINRFSDIEKHWAKTYINSSAEKGWINGYADGTFRPDNIIVRCEAAKLINEVLDRRVNIEGLHEDTKHWPDNTQDKWYYEIMLEASNTHDYERADKPKSMERWIRIKPNPVW